MHDASTCDTRGVCPNCRKRIKNAQITVVDKHFLEFEPVFAWCIAQVGG